MYTPEQVQKKPPWRRKDLSSLSVEEKMRYLPRLKHVLKLIREMKENEYIEVKKHGKTFQLKEAYRWLYPEEDIKNVIIRDEKNIPTYILRKAKK